MQIRSVGIDLGKTTFHLVALGAAGKVLMKKKFSQKQLREHADFVDWSRSLLGGALPRTSFEATGPRRAIDSSAVREAVCEVQQERFR